MGQYIVTNFGNGDTPSRANPRTISPAMKSLLLCLVLALAAGGAFAQGKKHEGKLKGQNMSREERQRMRDDMRDVYRDRGGRPAGKQRQMSPEEREKLRRDIQDANRDLRRGGN
jgi:Spy/CpxP family protein refolding chaperone